MLKSGKFPELHDSGEEYINQMRAITGQMAFRTNVNLPNVGQIPNLAKNAVVETNACFASDSVEPVASGPLPDSILPLILPHVQNHENILKAVWNGDKDLGFQAFINDPLVNIPLDKAWKMYNEMLNATEFKY